MREVNLGIDVRPVAESAEIPRSDWFLHPSSAGRYLPNLDGLAERWQNPWQEDIDFCHGCREFCRTPARGRISGPDLPVGLSPSSSVGTNPSLRLTAP